MRAMDMQTEMIFNPIYALAARAKSPVPRPDASTPIGFLWQLEAQDDDDTHGTENSRSCILQRLGARTSCRVMLSMPSTTIPHASGPRHHECGADTLLRCDQCLRPACREHCKLDSRGAGSARDAVLAIVCNACAARKN